MSKKFNFGPKEHITVSVFIDVSNPNSLSILDLDEEAKLDKSKLPENIIEVKSGWSKPTFSMANIIDMNQYTEKVVQGKIQKVWDVNAMVLARIRVLLKTWNLDTFDPDYKLDLVPSIDNPKILILSDDTMNRIGQVEPPALINAMYNKAIGLLYPEEEKLLKKLQDIKSEKNLPNSEI